LRWLRVRQGLEQGRVDHAEDCRGRADAEREREDGRRREAGAAAQCAQGVAEVAQKALDRGDAAPLAVLLLGRLDAAELYDRLSARLLRTHAGAQVVFDLHLEMSLQLLGQLPVAPPLVE
jgi:hypothetical protein